MALRCAVEKPEMRYKKDNLCISQEKTFLTPQSVAALALSAQVVAEPTPM